MNKSSHRARAWFAGLAGVLLVAALLAPAAAQALSVTQASTRFNGSSGQNTYGAIPTRFTWQVLIKKGDPAVSGLRIALPKGTDLSKSTVSVVMVQGLDQIPLKTTAAKLFATFYALYSGVAFLTIMAVLMAPLLHRLLHKFHIEISEDDHDDDKPRKSPA